MHLDPEREHAFSVDENGYVHNYVHGDAHSVAIMGGRGEMIFHNHPVVEHFQSQICYPLRFRQKKEL